MASCPRCEGFAQVIPFSSPGEYRDLVRQLIKVVQQGTLQIIHADCPLEELFGPVWPEDVIVHKFRCSACGRLFSLRADTYHGNARWRPL